MTEQKTSLAVFDPHVAMVADLVKKNEVQNFDHTTEEGETAIRSWVHRLRGGKGDIEKARKATKADILTMGKKIDAKAKELTAPLEKMITENMKDLDEIEAKKRAEAEAIVEAEEAAILAKEAEELAELKRREEVVAKKEAEIAEKERIEREARIAAEAAENAKKEAEEKAEREKQAIIDAAAKAKALAEAKVKADENARIAKLAGEATERAMKAEAEEAEKDRLAEAERKRIENEDHRADVQILISKSIAKHAKCAKQTADNIVASLVRGDIPNVTINY